MLPISATSNSELSGLHFLVSSYGNGVEIFWPAEARMLYLSLLIMQSSTIRTFLRNFPLLKCHDAAKSEMICPGIDISLAARTDNVA
jgi:hypothetical protein